jgi:hypothetical protein
MCIILNKTFEFEFEFSLIFLIRLFIAVDRVSSDYKYIISLLVLLFFMACATINQGPPCDLCLGPQRNNLIQSVAPAIKNLMMMNVAITALVTPIRLQNMRLHWDNRNVYFEGTLVDGPPFLGKA